MKTRTLALFLGATLGLATAGTAFAHASIAPASASVGATIKAVVTIPHGCDGAATTGISVTLPEGFVLAKPQPKPGWALAIETADYRQPADDHGTPVASGAHVISWTGGNLPDSEFDEFAIQGSFQNLSAQTTARFPVLQTCGDTSVEWTEIPAEGQNPHALPHPAPAIIVTPGTGSGHGHMDMGAMGSMDSMDMGGMAAASADPGAPVTVGDLEITAAFTRATLPNAPVAGGYFTVTNSGTADDRLVSAASPAAGAVELHEMSMQGDVMKMTPFPDGIAVKAGETVTLSPSGLHLMFMQLRHPFVEGESVPVTLTFEKAGAVEVQLPVAGIGADAPAGMSGMKM